MTGTIGSTTPLANSVTFNLVIKNPCIDPDYVKILPVALPTGTEYILHDFEPTAKFEFTHSPFTVDTKPLVGHSLCGPLSYEATFRGSPIDASSEPMSYTGTSNTFAIYSEDDNLIGLQPITMVASFTQYSQINAGPAITTDILIIDPCVDPFDLVNPGQTPPTEYLYKGM